MVKTGSYLLYRYTCEPVLNRFGTGRTGSINRAARPATFSLASTV